MAKNRITTYLLYAVGEIFLVVIGILIAVSINNWNQNRKDRMQEKSFVELLVRDLRADSTLLAERIATSNQVVRSKDIILQFKDEATKPDSLNAHFGRAIFTAISQFVPNEGAIEEIKNAGGISLINDEGLKNHILDLYNQYEIFEQNVGKYHLENTLKIRELVYQKANGALFQNWSDWDSAIVVRISLDDDIRNRVINSWAKTYNSRLKEIHVLNTTTLSNCRNYIGELEDR